MVFTPKRDTPKPAPADQGQATQPPKAAPPASALRPAGIEQPHSTGSMYDMVGLPADLTRPQTWHDWRVREYNPTPRDWANTYGDAFSYHTIPLATAGAEKAGAPVPAQYGSDAQRQALEQSRRALGPSGPAVTALGYMTSPLTYLGVGPIARGVAGAAESGLSRFLPEAAQRFIAPSFEGGTTAALTGASQTAGGGGSLWDTLKSAGANFLIGAPLGAGAAALSGKGQSAADIANKTQAEADAAKANLEQMRFANPGIKIAGKTPQTEAEFQAALDWAKNVKPSDDPLGGAPVVASKLQSVLDQPGPQAAIDAANAAATRAANAAQLQRMRATADVPGADIRGQARSAMENLPPDTPEFDAFKSIASAPTGYEPRWLGPTKFASEIAPSVLHDIGRGIGWLGVPGSSTLGQLGGRALGSALRQYAGAPVSPVPLQQSLSAASPALTGYSVIPPGKPMAAANPLMYIYQNIPPIPPPSQWGRPFDISNYADTMM